MAHPREKSLGPLVGDSKVKSLSRLLFLAALTLPLAACSRTTSPVYTGLAGGAGGAGIGAAIGSSIANGNVLASAGLGAAIGLPLGVAYGVYNLAAIQREKERKIEEERRRQEAVYERDRQIDYLLYQLEQDGRSLEIDIPDEDYFDGPTYGTPYR